MSDYEKELAIREWVVNNVDYDYMADSDHRWDDANTPEATAEGFGRG